MHTYIHSYIIMFTCTCIGMVKVVIHKSFEIATHVLAMTTTMNYKLQHGEILLPPQILPESITKGGQHVVRIHYGVYECVQHWREKTCIV